MVYTFSNILDEEHKQKCGGEFIKIAEPEGFKARKPKEGTSKAVETITLDKFFKKPEST